MALKEQERLELPPPSPRMPRRRVDWLGHALGLTFIVLSWVALAYPPATPVLLVGLVLAAFVIAFC